MNKNIYPTPYEVKEVLNSFIKRNDVNKFAQSIGVVLINAKQDEASSEISNLLFDIKDIDILRSLAYQSVSKHSLSGFTIESKNNNIDIENLYNNIRDHGVLTSQGYNLKSLSKTTKSEIDYYKGSIEYTKKRPGRIQFFDEEKGFCEFSFFELKKGEWQVEIDGNKSSDGKEVFNLFSKIINKEDTFISNITIDYLKDKSTIDFFDELGKTGMGNNWRLSNVTQLTIKRSKNYNNDDDEAEDDEIEKEQLTGIRQAILDGRNLREDPFVTNYEESGGCLFTAMTYEFENKNTSETIQIRAEFKGNPKIFEVSIIDYFKNEGTDVKKKSTEISPDNHMKYRSIFWNNAKEIYKKHASKN